MTDPQRTIEKLTKRAERSEAMCTSLKDENKKLKHQLDQVHTTAKTDKSLAMLKSAVAKSGFSIEDALNAFNLKVPEYTLCPFCDEPKTQGELSVEHFMPINRGGCNHDHNKIIACKECNNKKDNMPPLTWLHKIGKYDNAFLISRLNECVECKYTDIGFIIGMLHKASQILLSFPLTIKKQQQGRALARRIDKRLERDINNKKNNTSNKTRQETR